MTEPQRRRDEINQQRKAENEAAQDEGVVESIEDAFEPLVQPLVLDDDDVPTDVERQARRIANDQEQREDQPDILRDQ